jgi:hypothetical protein
MLKCLMIHNGHLFIEERHLFDFLDFLHLQSLYQELKDGNDSEIYCQDCS